MLYMIFYYRLLGIVVMSGLAVTGAILWAIISAWARGLDTTIDLAGIIGIIVSIGITVDSYIVYFERLKDETRSGRTVRTSVDKGFASAFRTVLAADAVSLLGAAILYLISVGPVKGFALFLGISTVLDVFVTYFFTRPFVILLGQRRAASDDQRLGMASGLGVPRRRREPPGARRGATGDGTTGPTATTTGPEGLDDSRRRGRSTGSSTRSDEEPTTSSTPRRSRRSSRRSAPRTRTGRPGHKAPQRLRPPLPGRDVLRLHRPPEVVVRRLRHHHPGRGHLPRDPRAQPGHRLQGRPVVDGRRPRPSPWPRPRRRPSRPGSPSRRWWC